MALALFLTLMITLMLGCLGLLLALCVGEREPSPAEQALVRYLRKRRS